MKRLFLAGLIACLSVAASAVAAPLEAYGRLPAIEDVQVSPDGTLLASSITMEGEQRYIVIRKIADNSVVFSIAAGSAKLRDMRWAGSGHIVVTTSRTSLAHGIEGGRREYFLALLLDIKTRKSKHLLASEEHAMNVVTRPPEVRMINGSPSLLLYGFRLQTSRGLHTSNMLYLTVFRHDIAKGRTSLLAQGEDGIDDWEVAPDGKILARSMYSQSSGRWSLQMRKSDGDGWSTVAEDILPLGSPRLRGIGRTADSVITLSPLEAEEGDDDSQDRRRLREYRLSGTWDLPAATNQLIHDPATNLLVGSGELVGDTGRYTFFDPKADSAWKAILRAYPGQNVSLASWSDDRRIIVVRVDDPKMGPAYALVDLNQRKAAWIGDVYQGVTADDVAEQRAITYRSQDGQEIPAYLTLPRGRDPKNLPLIVLPHGGPASRDTLGFDWWSQALASRGYAVLQPNFRGSTGIRPGWREAGFGEWGRKMQTDVSDGVKHLAKEGVIDPKRVCIVGGSYGGYAALAGVTVEQGLYRCAVSVNGVADLRRMLLQTQAETGRRSSALRYWSAFMGVDGARDRDLEAISPAVLAARTDAPVLLIHGKDDTVVPYDQSRVMADALKKAGKPHEFVTLPGEDHWLSRGETRLQMLQATVAFLERENPPQ